MPSAKVYNLEGQVVGTRQLPDEIFGVPVKPGLLALAVVAQQANARTAIAHTKTRGEVRGGGRKPWRQKGTGRARHGSIRSPIWIGGGITFGPRANRNYALKINRKVRRQALLGSLSAKASGDGILLVEDLAPVGKKSKLAAQLLAKLKLRPTSRKSGVAGTGSQAGSRPVTPLSIRPPTVLVVLPSQAKDQVLAFRNLQRVSMIAADSLNVNAVLGHRYLLMPLTGLEQLIVVYGAKSKAAAPVTV